MDRNALELERDEFTGRRYGKYELVCRLSRGGMANLFLATARGAAGFQKLVVLKKVLPDVADNPDFVRRFLEEARVMAGFNHPHIAQVFDLDIQDGDYFLAMEFVTGATMLEIVNGYIAHGEPMPLGLALAAGRDVASALHYAHTYVDPLGRPRRVVHRDVAPKNVMVTYEGVAKLLDFGVAKTQETGGTQVGMVIGTPGYMSPEQAVGQALDGRSDLYSLAITLFECITGRRLFGRETAEEEMRAPLEADPPAPSSFNPRIPRRVDDVLLQALARRKEDRFATGLDFSRALATAGAELSWPPEKCGEAVKRLFARRREQTRRLLQALEDASDPTGLDFKRLSLHLETTEPSLPAFREDAAKRTPGEPLPPAKPLPKTRPARLRAGPLKVSAGAQEEAMTERVGHARSRWRWALVPLLAIAVVVLLAKLLPASPSELALSLPGVADAGGAARTGQLSLKTDVPCEVWLGDAGLGATPLEGVALPQGEQVLMVGMDGGGRRVLRVTIVADSPTALEVKVGELSEAADPP